MDIRDLKGGLVPVWNAMAQDLLFGKVPVEVDRKFALELIGKANGDPDFVIACECGSKDELQYGPNPYYHDVHGDETNVILCGTCWCQYADDV